MRWGQRTRQATMDDLVNLCENLIAYDSTLIVAAISEMLGAVSGADVASAIQSSLAQLLKRMKYGLSHPDEIALYELGFADRIAVNRILLVLPDQHEESIRSRMRDNVAVTNTLATLPRYFQHCYANVM